VSTVPERSDRKICFEAESIEAIAAASIYGACRCNGHSRLLTMSSTQHASNNRSRKCVQDAEYRTWTADPACSTERIHPRLASELDIPAYIRQRFRAGRTVGIDRSSVGRQPVRIRSCLSVQGGSRRGTMADTGGSRCGGERHCDDYTVASRHAERIGGLKTRSASFSVDSNSMLLAEI